MSIDIPSTRKCLVCAEILDEAPSSLCAVCESPMHPECMQFQGRCPVYGCGGTVFFAPVDEMLSKEATLAADGLLDQQVRTLVLQFLPTLACLSLMAKWIPNILIVQIIYAFTLAVLAFRAAFFSGRRVEIDPQGRSVSESFYFVGFKMSRSKVVRVADGAFLYLVETGIGLRPVLVNGSPGGNGTVWADLVVPLGGITGPTGHYRGHVWSGMAQLSNQWLIPIVSQENNWVRERAISKRRSDLEAAKRFVDCSRPASKDPAAKVTQSMTGVGPAERATK